MKYFLFGLGNMSIIAGGLVLSQAETVQQEQEALLLFLTAAVLIGSGAIVKAIESAAVTRKP